jgi:hypothetical protein
MSRGCNPNLDFARLLKANATFCPWFQHHVHGLVSMDQLFRRAGDILSAEWVLAFLNSRRHSILNTVIIGRSKLLLPGLVADMEEAA